MNIRRENNRKQRKRKKQLVISNELIMLNRHEEKILREILTNLNIDFELEELEKKSEEKLIDFTDLVNSINKETTNSDIFKALFEATGWQ